jgi:cyclin-dependent kinase 10
MRHRYRAPELLLGAEMYGTAVDCWALGCIMGELLNHAPLMPGRAELHQFELIVRLLGSPSDAIWPGMSSLPLAKAFHLPAQPYNNISTKVWLSLSFSATNVLLVWVHFIGGY